MPQRESLESDQQEPESLQPKEAPSRRFLENKQRRISLLIPRPAIPAAPASDEWPFDFALPFRFSGALRLESLEDRRPEEAT